MQFIVGHVVDHHDEEGKDKKGCGRRSLETCVQGLS